MVARLLSRRFHTAVGLASCALLVGSYSRLSDAAEPRVTKVTLVPSELDLPDGFSATQFRDALTSAAARWSYPAVACTSVVIEVDAAASRRRTERDGRWLFVFRKSRWCHNEQCGPGTTYPRLAAAMTTVYDETASAGVAEADVELNASAFEGAASAPLVPVLAHEIGHVLGFQDTCGTRHGAGPDPGCPRDELESIMLSGSSREQLTGWDIQRLCSRFPRNEGGKEADASPDTQGDPSLGWCALAATAAALAVAWFFAYCVRGKRRGGGH